mmetsp:Transcript_42948/g.89822  ORF Transcript_42948/g.89822 Transcript_42948/m.89822 type:complete len:232 (+) Transcript_42948:331-1026(+)
MVTPQPASSLPTALHRVHAAIRQDRPRPAALSAGAIWPCSIQAAAARAEGRHQRRRHLRQRRLPRHPCPSCRDRHCRRVVVVIVVVRFYLKVQRPGRGSSFHRRRWRSCSGRGVGWRRRGVRAVCALGPAEGVPGDEKPVGGGDGEGAGHDDDGPVHIVRSGGEDVGQKEDDGRGHLPDGGDDCDGEGERAEVPDAWAPAGAADGASQDDGNGVRDLGGRAAVSGDSGAQI